MSVVFAFVLAAPAPAPDPGRLPPSPPLCAELDAKLEHAVELRQHGRRCEARDQNLEIRDAAQAAGCPLAEARAWLGLAELSVLEGQLIIALEQVQHGAEGLERARAETSVDRQTLTALEAKLARQQGEATLRLGRLDEALDAARKLEASARRRQDPADLCDALLLAVRVLRQNDQLHDAGEKLEEAFGLFERVLANTRASMYQEKAWLAIDADPPNLVAADAALAQALTAAEEWGDPLTRANVLVDRAEVALLRQRPQASLRWIADTLRLANAAETPDLALEAHAHYLYSVALAQLGDRESARWAGEHALNILEVLREPWQDLGLSFFARRQRYFWHRLDLAVADANLRAALGTFESFRARGLLASLGRRAGLSDQPLKAAEESELKAVRREVQEALQQLDSGDRSPDKLAHHLAEIRFRSSLLHLDQLHVRLLEARGQRPPPELASLETAQEQLDPGTLTLVFARGTDRLYLLVLDPEKGLSGRSLDARWEEVETLVDDFSKALHPNQPRLSGSQRRNPAAMAAELSQVLLAPVAAELAGARRLVIVADAPLEDLPFEILPHPRTGEPLVKSHDVVYLPSFSVLAATRARACARPTRELFALGDPIFSDRDARWPIGAASPRSADEALLLGRLPATATEVENLGRLYGLDATLARGAEATRERFLAEAPDYQVLQLASHGLSDAFRPERTKIALSCIDAAGPVPEAACDLYFTDVTNLELCGPLVVLSACATAVGRSVDGEGILGLPWAFLHAGAASVVASLWPVPDEDTTTLMTAFHRHLRAGDGPAAALSAAKRELLAAGRPPSSWAAFILLGDWRR